MTRLQQKFSSLLENEIRAQPGLEQEIRAAGWLARPRPLTRSMATVMEMPRELVDPVLDADPDPVQAHRWMADILAARGGDAYASKCRSALVHMYHGHLADAEHVLYLARQERDSAAQAHHLTGILRGLQGDLEGARLELHLALEREGLEAARRRISEALEQFD